MLDEAPIRRREFMKGDTNFGGAGIVKYNPDFDSSEKIKASKQRIYAYFEAFLTKTDVVIFSSF